MKFINIGFGNMVSAGRIVAIASPDSEPIKRLVRDAKDTGRVIDASCGRRTRSVIITDSEHIKALFAMTPYYWKSAPADRDRLYAQTGLETEIAFDLLLYKKDDDYGCSE